MRDMFGRLPPVCPDTTNGRYQRSFPCGPSQPGQRQRGPKVHKYPRHEPPPTDSRSVDPRARKRGCLIPPAGLRRTTRSLMLSEAVSRSRDLGPRSAIGESGCLSTPCEETAALLPCHTTLGVSGSTSNWPAQMRAMLGGKQKKGKTGGKMRSACGMWTNEESRSVPDMTPVSGGCRNVTPSAFFTSSV